MNLHTRNAPVPRAFVITSNHCFEPAIVEGKGYTQESTFNIELRGFVRWLAQSTGKTWAGDAHSDKKALPLLVSARSGAAVSMPGMMDTILNIGITPENIERFPNKAFALDAYRRLIQMFANTVCGVNPDEFREVHDAAKVFFLIPDEHSAQVVVDRYLEIFKTQVGTDFPTDPNVQLLDSINAVFKSWHNNRAKVYRDIEGIPEDMGTAATVQEMVFGNLSETSGTGVVFSHDPNTGIQGLYGDFLANAQGEDVVSGSYSTVPIEDMKKSTAFKKNFNELNSWVKNLVNYEKDMLDIEFTIEDGKLFLLQTRKAKRSRRADVSFVMQQMTDGIMDRETAVQRIMDHMPNDTGTTDVSALSMVGRGVATNEGIVAAKIAVGQAAAQKFIDSGEKYIFVAKETDPDDVLFMSKSIGMLTATGGVVSHAAVVARNWNIPCVVGFEQMEVFEDYVCIGDKRVATGDLMKINAQTGDVWA